jgi:succinoglycan biosynthesis transport protein ExoP
MNERTTHPLEYLAMLRRHTVWIVSIFILCVTVGVALAVFLPATYMSGATIAVESPAVSPDLVAGRAQLDRDERLRAVTQQLKSQNVLARVAREEQLLADRPVEQVIAGLLQNIDVKVQKGLAQDGQQELNAFDIVYKDATAERAQRITNRLANVFVDEHSKSREQQAEGTAEFLAQQLRASQERMEQLEGRLRAAKEQHMGKLPEQALANLETVSGMRQQLASTSSSLRGEQDRLSLIERQLDQMKQGAAGASPIGPAGPNTPQQRVIQLQGELAVARTKYKPTHPEIQWLEQELQMARKEAADLRQQPESARQELLAADPSYQQAMADRSLTQLRIRSLQQTENQLQRDILKYQQRIEASPMVEQQMVSLTREYDLERENNKQLTERHQAALMQEQIARTRGGERFSVLYGAYLPDSPESPNRLRILLMAIAAGLALGVGAAFAREFLDRSVRDARSLQANFDVPVLAEIPRIHTA